MATKSQADVVSAYLSRKKDNEAKPGSKKPSFQARSLGQAVLKTSESNFMIKDSGGIGRLSSRQIQQGFDRLMNDLYASEQLTKRQIKTSKLIHKPCVEALIDLIGLLFDNLIISVAMATTIAFSIVYVASCLASQLQILYLPILASLAAGYSLGIVIKIITSLANKR